MKIEKVKEEINTLFAENEKMSFFDILKKFLKENHLEKIENVLGKYDIQKISNSIRDLIYINENVDKTIFKASNSYYKGVERNFVKGNNKLFDSDYHIDILSWLNVLSDYSLFKNIIDVNKLLSRFNYGALNAKYIYVRNLDDLLVLYAILTGQNKETVKSLRAQIQTEFNKLANIPLLPDMMKTKTKNVLNGLENKIADIRKSFTYNNQLNYVKANEDFITYIKKHRADFIMQREAKEQGKKNYQTLTNKQEFINDNGQYLYFTTIKAMNEKLLQISSFVKQKTNQGFDKKEFINFEMNYYLNKKLGERYQEESDYVCLDHDGLYIGLLRIVCQLLLPTQQNENEQKIVKKYQSKNIFDILKEMKKTFNKYSFYQFLFYESEAVKEKNEKIATEESEKIAIETIKNIKVSLERLRNQYIVLLLFEMDLDNKAYGNTEQKIEHINDALEKALVRPLGNSQEEMINLFDFVVYKVICESKENENILENLKSLLLK